MTWQYQLKKKSWIWNEDGGVGNKSGEDVMLTHGNSQNDPLFFLNTTCLKSKTILENLDSDPHINCINLHTHLHGLFTTSNYGISLGVYKLVNG